jgi:hypothetical protein
MTCVGQRICGVEDVGAAVNCGFAATCARITPGIALVKRSRGSRSRERITPDSKLTGDPEQQRPKRLERVRTGWDVHFRELALTRIPVKITTPSQHFKL